MPSPWRSLAARGASPRRYCDRPTSWALWRGTLTSMQQLTTPLCQSLALCELAQKPAIWAKCPPLFKNVVIINPPALCAMLAICAGAWAAARRQLARSPRTAATASTAPTASANNNYVPLHAP
eukprot:8942832-Lingulodinium_polyedra.AAC.1